MISPKSLIQPGFCVTLLCAIVATAGCYRMNRLPASRLEHTLQLPGLRYVALDAKSPKDKIWLLHNVRIDDKTLIATFQKAPDGFGQYIQNIYDYDSRNANRDFVYLYIHPYYASAIPDRSEYTLEFKQIKKIMVSEPGMFESAPEFLLGCGAVGAAYFLINVPR